MRVRRVGDLLEVRTVEDYLKRPRPGLIESAVVLDARARPGGGHHALESLCDQSLDAPIARSLAERFPLDARPDPSSLPTLVNRLQQDLSLCPGSQLGDMCGVSLRDLQALTFSDGGERVFPRSTVHWIRRDEAVVRRVKLSSVLVRLQHDRRLADGDLQGVLAEHSAGSNVFASSAALSDGVYVFDAYVAPLLACLSPAVWAFAVHRIHGTLVFAYGRAVSGASGEPGEMLRTLRTVGGKEREAGTVTYGPFDSEEAATVAIAWWAHRLDEMFGVLTDPGVFVDCGGEFAPTSSLQALLGVEQVFRRVNSLLLAHHDTHTRRALAFTVLDTLRSLMAVSLDRMFNYEFAVKTLRDLESVIPVPAQEILLPAARRSVEALRSVQEGFFLTDADGFVSLAGKRVSRAEAAAEYLVVLRDATHGFTTNRAAAREKVSTLLAVHSGELDHDIGLIAWLYLLAFLVRPGRFRSVVSREVERLESPRRSLASRQSNRT